MQRGLGCLGWEHEEITEGAGGQLDFLQLVEELTLKLSQEELELFFC